MNTDRTSVIELFRNKQYREALAAIDQLPADLRINSEMHFYAGLCLFELGDDLRAIDAFAAALSMGVTPRRREQILYNRALAYREAKHYRAAIADLQHIDQSRGQTHSLLAEMLYYTADGDATFLNEALRHGQVWLEAHPSDGLVWHIVGSCLNHLGRYDESLAAILKALENGYVTKFSIGSLRTALRSVDREAELEGLLAHLLNPSTDPDGTLRTFVKQLGEERPMPAD